MKLKIASILTSAVVLSASAFGAGNSGSCNIHSGIKSVENLENLDSSELSTLFTEYGAVCKKLVPLAGKKSTKKEVHGSPLLVLGTNKLNSKVFSKVWSGKVFRSNSKGKVFATNRILPGYSDRLDAGKASVRYTSKNLHKDGKGVILLDYSKAKERVLHRFKDELRVVGQDSKNNIYLGRTSLVLFGIAKTVGWFTLEVPRVDLVSDEATEVDSGDAQGDEENELYDGTEE